MLRRVIPALFLIIIFGSLVGYWYMLQSYEYSLVTPVDQSSTARVTFTVDKGESGKKIAEKLADLDLIISEWAFYKYIKEENIAPQLEAGKFILKKSYTIPEIAQYLTNARKDEIVVTIREGLTLEQVDEHLAETSVLPTGSFVECAKTCAPDEHYSFLDSRPRGQSLEGYLFPDTYFIDPETVNPKQIVNRMLNNFEQKLDSELRSKIAQQGFSIHEIVTMASLIEKESRHPEEKPIIAGILWKRLKEGMVLGVDATVRFALNKWTAPLTIEDLSGNSPYNTRKKGGLPPGPISNFSLNSLKAAINPEASEYYYYLHDNEGNIHYASTNDEHNENKRKYLQ